MADLNQLGREMALMTPRERSKAMKIGKLKPTERGFKRVEWRDRYGQHCHLSKSSLATEDCVWLGENTMPMHLTQKQAGKLAALLAHFAEHGELP